MKTQMKQTTLFSLIFFLACSSLAHAAMAIRLPEQVSAEPDGSVLVPVTVDDAANIAGGLITLTFDDNLVSVDAVQKGDLINDFQFVSHIVGEEIRIAFSNARGLTLDSGTVVTIALQVNPQVQDGSVGVLNLSQADFYDEAAQEVATTIIHGTVDLIPSLIAFVLTIPQGLGLIHLPLAVKRPMEIRTIGDLYDALGSDNVNFLITFDSIAGVWRSYLGHSSRATPADLPLAADTGVLTLMKSAVTLHLEGNAWGVDGNSTIQLRPGINPIGVPLKDERLKQVSDLLNLEGIQNNAAAIIVYDAGKFKVVGQPGDDGDIPITGEAAFIITARQASVVEIRGEAW